MPICRREPEITHRRIDPVAGAGVVAEELDPFARAEKVAGELVALLGEMGR
jgi:hypothetical protein